MRKFAGATLQPRTRTEASSRAITSSTCDSNFMHSTEVEQYQVDYLDAKGYAFGIFGVLCVSPDAMLCRLPHPDEEVLLVTHGEQHGSALLHGDSDHSAERPRTR